MCKVMEKEKKKESSRSDMYPQYWTSSIRGTYHSTTTLRLFYVKIAL